MTLEHVSLNFFLYAIAKLAVIWFKMCLFKHPSYNHDFNAELLLWQIDCRPISYDMCTHMTFACDLLVHSKFLINLQFITINKIITKISKKSRLVWF